MSFFDKTADLNSFVLLDPEPKNDDFGVRGPLNEQLYNLFILIQAPHKKLLIYKDSSQHLLTLTEPYVRHALDLNEVQHSGQLQRAVLWYRNYLRNLLEWTTWDVLTTLVNRDTINKEMEKLARQVPREVLRHSTSGKDMSIPSEPIDEIKSLVQVILSSKEDLKSAMRLRGKDAQSFVNLLDTMMDSAEPGSRFYSQCLHGLRKLCGRCSLLPSACVISEDLSKVSEEPLMSGGFADIWKGKYESKIVALKVLRIYGSDNLKKVKESFCREAVLWKRLMHPNIVVFLGVSTILFPLCMIPEWMENGNIVTYLKRRPRANRLELLVDITKGLRYLHSIGVLHGDLKGANILIDDLKHACLADFGLTSVTYDPNTVNAITTSSATHGSIRWMAPEIFHPEQAGLDKSQPSAESDIYAFAMVSWEVFTGLVPFHNQPREATVVFNVTLGIRPERPPPNITALGLSDIVWSLMEMCWQGEWRKRPRVPFVLQCLEEAHRQFVPPPESQIPQIRDDFRVGDVDDSSDDVDDESGTGAFLQDFTIPRVGQDQAHPPGSLFVFPDLTRQPEASAPENGFTQTLAGSLERLDLSSETIHDRNNGSVWKGISDELAWVS